jgi:Fe2+ or Zn2+ uptake regulation protein
MSSQLIAKVNDSLKIQGYRHSALRDKILEILDLSDEPATVLDIISGLAKDKIHPNKTTVYRELETLSKHNIIYEVNLGEGKKRYELASDQPHPHLICKKCGSIKCTKLNLTIESWLTSFCTQNNFKLEDHVLEFFGICQICNQNN